MRLRMRKHLGLAALVAPLALANAGCYAKFVHAEDFQNRNQTLAVANDTLRVDENRHIPAHKVALAGWCAVDGGRHYRYLALNETYMRAHDTLDAFGFKPKPFHEVLDNPTYKQFGDNGAWTFRYAKATRLRQYGLLSNFKVEDLGKLIDALHVDGLVTAYFVMHPRNNSVPGIWFGEDNGRILGAGEIELYTKDANGQCVRDYAAGFKTGLGGAIAIGAPPWRLWDFGRTTKEYVHGDELIVDNAFTLMAAKMAADLGQ